MVLALNAKGEQPTDERLLSQQNTLRIALLLVGLIFIFGIYPLTVIWPPGWS